MANPTGKGGKKIQPGEVRNPTGRPKLSASANAFKKTSLEDFIENVQKYGAMNARELYAICGEDSEGSEPAFSTMAAQWVLDCIAGKPETRHTAREALLNRLWGKVTDKHEHLGLPPPPQVIITLPKKE